MISMLWKTGAYCDDLNNLGITKKGEKHQICNIFLSHEMLPIISFKTTGL